MTVYRKNEKMLGVSASGDDFTCACFTVEDILVIKATGTMGLQEMPIFQENTEHWLSEYKCVVIDLSDLRYVNSSCIAMFVQLYKRFHPQGKKAVIMSPTDYVLKILSMVGLERLLPVCHDWDTAVRVLRKRVIEEG